MFFNMLHLKPVRICVFLLLLVGAILQFRYAMQEQMDSTSRKELRGPSGVHSARMLTYYAQKKQMFEADMDGALSLLQQALINNPVYVPAWLSLVELKNDTGDKQQADKVLQYAVSLTRDLKRYRWELSLVAYQLGKIDMLPGELQYIIREISGKNRNDALQLAFTLWEEPEILLDNVGHENVSYLLRYAVGKRLPQRALFFWDIIESEGLEWQDRQVYSFLDMLIVKGYLQQAGQIWRKHFNPNAILFNGDFSQNFMQVAFGWRAKKEKDFVQTFGKMSQSGKGRSVRYRFKGWANVNFHHLYQIVPIKGGKKYMLSYECKSRKLSTNQRPFLKVYGYKCKMSSIKSAMFESDQDWGQYNMTFNVPQECSALVVRLRRKESRHIDNKLEGEFWLRNIAITDIDESSTALDELSQ